jgi:hypothetical protein
VRVGGIEPLGRPAAQIDGGHAAGNRGAQNPGYMVGESIAPRNRALIAAAPEMLDLLKEFQAFVRDGNHFGYPLGSVQKLDELISKASAEA